MEEKIEKIEEISFRVPEKLLKEFGKDARLVHRRDIVGVWPIPPDWILKLKPELKDALKDYDLILVPKIKGR